MKFTSQEEFGLRCLLRLGREAARGSLTISEISGAEGISEAYVAKLLRVLRRGGFVTSARGQAGGYTLSRPASEINVGEALAFLGGRLFEAGFCDRHAGVGTVCTSSVDCSIRSLWSGIQHAVDQVLSKLSLQDLLGSEQEVSSHVGKLVEIAAADWAAPVSSTKQC